MVKTFGYEFTRKGPLLHFAKLPFGDTCPSLFTLGFKDTDRGGDPWTERFWNFKAGESTAACGAGRVLSLALQSIATGKKDVIAVSSLPHDESNLSTSHHMYTLGQTVCDNMEWNWVPEALSKKTHAPIKGLSAENRKKEIWHSYQFAYHQNPRLCIVFEDFVTRGTTIAEISRAIRAVKPKTQICAIALGKTERFSFAANRGWKSVSNDHIPPNFASEWDISYEF